MPIEPGAIVKCSQTGDHLWVVKVKEPGQRWLLVSKIKRRGIATQAERVAGEGDLNEVVSPPSYEIGATVELDGVAYTVSADLGEDIEVEVPASIFPLEDGGALHLPGGNTAIVSKADLVLEQLK